MDKSDPNRSGYQMGSTSDEPQDPLLGELVIVSQPSDLEETIEEMLDQEQEPAEETEITISAIIEEINRSISSKNSSMQEDTQVLLKESKESPNQSTGEESQNSLLGEQTDVQQTSEIEPPLGNQPAANIKSISSKAMLQNINSNGLIIPREEFTLIDDPDSLEEIVIYDMVVEYQTKVTINTNIDDDIVEIKAETQENNSEATIKQHSSLSQSEIMTDSQITVDHEEITSAIEPTLEQPPRRTRRLGGHPTKEQNTRRVGTRRHTRGRYGHDHQGPYRHHTHQ